MDIADIPGIPDREKRFEEITVDCYDENEVLSAFEVYLTDALRTPFTATWGTSGTPQADRVTVWVWPIRMIVKVRAFACAAAMATCTSAR